MALLKPLAKYNEAKRVRVECNFTEPRLFYAQFAISITLPRSVLTAITTIYIRDDNSPELASKTLDLTHFSRSSPPYVTFAFGFHFLPIVRTYKSSFSNRFCIPMENVPNISPTPERYRREHRVLAMVEKW